MSKCRQCAHKRNIPGDCHISCANPDPNMTGDEHGIKNGWFVYPWNFDPVWMTKECSNFITPADLKTTKDLLDSITDEDVEKFFGIMKKFSEDEENSDVNSILEFYGKNNIEQLTDDEKFVGIILYKKALILDWQNEK